MKYIILVGDGMADRPIRKIGYKTCLQKAATPNMDKIASEGKVGRIRTIPRGFPLGSDVANLSILGYDPSKYYSGRAPFEAAYRGVSLKRGDVAYRCNLVTLKLSKSKDINMAVMEDYSAGHISTREAKILIKVVNRKLGGNKIIFYPAVSYRHLMVWKNGKDKTHCTPPHDITGRKIGSYFPEGDGEVILREFIEKSTEILTLHSVNRKRISRGLRPANSIWLWGQGKKPAILKFKAKYGLKGALISAVDLTKGLGVCAGFDVINVKGATGYLDTNYLGKAKAALNALKTKDIVYLHVEAPDEAGHNGDIKAKIKAIEDFDSKVVGTVLKGIKKFKEYSILLLPDHPTPVNLMTHTDEPVPFAIYSVRKKAPPELSNRASRSDNTRDYRVKVNNFSEKICNMKGALVFEKGYKLMDYFIRK